VFAVHNAAMSRTILLALGFLAVTAVAASARPRDEVLSSAYRCATIGDSRTWLDCYYGAAQPVRAALGLKPVPASQSRLVAQPPAGAPVPGDSPVRDQVMTGAVRCTTVGDERQWLNCYYAAAQPMRVRLGLESAPRTPALQAILPAQPPQPAGSTSGFGARAVPVSPLGNADHVFAQMASYSFDKLGWFTVTLRDGQVWRQVDGDTTYAHWKKPADSYRVRLSKGFLGSFNLQVDGEPGLFKVHRIQ
jgi:hypothetical protein